MLVFCIAWNLFCQHGICQGFQGGLVGFLHFAPDGYGGFHYLALLHALYHLAHNFSRGGSPGAVLHQTEATALVCLYLQMVKILEDKCVWIYEGFPVSGVLNYRWLQNSIRHDFGFVRWKYLSVDPQLRMREKRNFKPLSLGELAGNKEKM